MLKFVAIVSFTLLGACSSLYTSDKNTTPVATPTNVQQEASAANRVFAIKTGYKALLIAANTYNALTPCERTNNPVCRDEEVILVMRRANNAARITMDTAEYIVRSSAVTEAAKKSSVESAESAMKAFESIVSSTKK